MKYLIITLLLVSGINASAQIIVDAGKDTTYCSGLWMHHPDTMYIGDNLSITGGTPPYSYQWTCKIQPTSNLIFHGSDFLNDTSINNPYFIEPYFNADWITFSLQMVDSEGSSGTDSIRIRFSRFAYVTNYFQDTISKGDSIQFPGFPIIGGGISPLFFAWHPTNSLSDSTDLSTYAFPEQTTEYSLYAIDAVGCKSDTLPFYRVIVDPLSSIHFSEDKNITGRIIRDMNTLKIKLTGNAPLFQHNMKIYIYSTSGKLLLSDNFKGNEYTIPKTFSGKQILIINIQNNKKIIYRKKVLF